MCGDVVLFACITGWYSFLQTVYRPIRTIVTQKRSRAICGNSHWRKSNAKFYVIYIYMRMNKHLSTILQLQTPCYVRTYSSTHFLFIFYNVIEPLGNYELPVKLEIFGWFGRTHLKRRISRKFPFCENCTTHQSLSKKNAWLSLGNLAVIVKYIQGDWCAAWWVLDIVTNCIPNSATSLLFSVTCLLPKC